ncbi:hypothetical protein A2U01_0077489, partial [Trifolium medium]|nr:hypothetical protein [Trifolium medium]
TLSHFLQEILNDKENIEEKEEKDKTVVENDKNVEEKKEESKATTETASQGNKDSANILEETLPTAGVAVDRMKESNDKAVEIEVDAQGDIKMD